MKKTNKSTIYAANKAAYATTTGKKMAESEGLFVIHYNKMGSNLANQFRRKLDGLDATYTVMPKRLFANALTAAGISQDLRESVLKAEGAVAVVTAKRDSIDVVKTIYDFSKEHAAEKDLFDVRCGFFEGNVMGAGECKALSELPSKDQLRAQLLALFEAPMSGTVGVINALLTSPLHCLEQKSQQS